VAGAEAQPALLRWPRRSGAVESASHARVGLGCIMMNGEGDIGQCHGRGEQMDVSAGQGGCW